MTSYEFWHWFVSNEKDLWRNSGTPAKFFAMLGPILASYREGLEAEVSDVENDRRELFISAGGDLRLFESVERLAAAAPKLDRWKVIAFKPSRGFDFVLSSDGITLTPEELHFEPLRSDADPTALGIRVFIDGASDRPGVLEVIRRVIEVGLGERVAATAIRRIETKEIPADLDKYLRLSELARYVEWFRAKVGYRD